MTDTVKFVQELRNLGIRQVAGVPCSTMTPLINELINQGMYLPFVNEGSAVAYAAGRNIRELDTAVILQNSGLTNASSPISSLTSLYDIPMLYFVGYRGKEGTKDEPQHRVLGPNTVKFILAVTESPTFISLDSIEEFVGNYQGRPQKSQTFCLIPKGTFTDVELKRSASDERPRHKECSRLNVIKTVKEFVSKNPDVFVLTTTGYTSRELMSFGEVDPRNFYMFGSMGCLYAFAHGVAKAYPDKKFIVIDGDGSVMMRLESTLECAALFPGLRDRILRIICDNGQHLSTGGQSLFNYRSFLSQALRSMTATYTAAPHEILDCLEEWYSDEYPSYDTLICNVAPTVEESLPRPTHTPQELLKVFKEGLENA